MTIPAEVPEPLAVGKGADSGSAAAKAARPSRRLADLWLRIFTASVLAIGAIASLVAGGLVFLSAWLAAALVVHFEWQRLIGGLRSYVRIGAGALAIVIAAIFANGNNIYIALFVLCFGALATAYLAEPGRRLWRSAGVVYAGSLIIALSALRLSFPFGPRAIGWLFAVVWGTDVMAYFGGRLMGGPRFVPQISPSKTWAGTACGLLGGACLGTIFLIVIAQVTRLDTPAPLHVLFILGLITSAVAQAGDLFESWTKRCFGAKDSSGLVPGHGGLMDRLDGFIAAAAWVTILGALRGFPSPAEGLFHWM